MITKAPQSDLTDWSKAPSLAWRLRWELTGDNGKENFEVISEWTQDTKPSWQKTFENFNALGMTGYLTIRGRGHGGVIETEMLKISTDLVLGLVYYNAVAASLANMPIVCAIAVALNSKETIHVTTEGQILASETPEDIQKYFTPTTREDLNANRNE